ncbi:hypothetical protein F0A16_11080 [Salinicola corii]|uniref:Lipoprotein n=1 Tax=Salinicola corii TaxID=2606937 RepID=A0A640WE62_9GAMM|nr:hypothetical protein [Salinicola corii]KAA0018253.1 hypothetical protein F0A16_11080 [Salinicola corii]
MEFTQGKRYRAGVVAASLLTLMLAGCSDSSPDADDDASGQASSAEQPTAQEPTRQDQTTDEPTPGTGGETRGGDGSTITLDALTASDIGEANLSGELGCQFSTAQASPLLVAKGNVDSSSAAQGVVKVAGYVERVSTPGGFDGMTGNPTFEGKGKTLRIEVTGEPSGGGESPARPATLTYDRADGAQRTLEGEWQCGP